MKRHIEISQLICQLTFGLGIKSENFMSNLLIRQMCIHLFDGLILYIFNLI